MMMGPLELLRSVTSVDRCTLAQVDLEQAAFCSNIKGGRPVRKLS